MISPGEACRLVSVKFDTRKTAQSFLLNYAGVGSIYVHAINTLEKSGKEASNKQISRTIFQRQRGTIAPSFWSSGQWVYGRTTFTGIQFDRDDVLKVAASHAPGFTRDPARDPIPGSGRDSGKHGEPIATIALRYIDRPSAEIARITATSLRDELAAEYKRIGKSAPAPKNMDGICAGILRAIKTKQSEA
ncbi:hypothetical protein [Erythrobacter sp. R86502]|uniref:hypothetical protein n=1 Tax=Erythrobacter sp. R86502 TaxID=3093846 RepID=UPI0036D2DE0E